MLFGSSLNELQQWGRDFILHCASLQLFANLQKLSLLPLLAESEEVFSSPFMKKPGRGLRAVLGAELADVQAQLIFLLRGGVAGAVPAPLCLLAGRTRAVGCAAAEIRDSSYISLVQNHPCGSCSDIIQNSSLYYKIIRVCQAGTSRGHSGCDCVPQLDRLL